VQVGEGGAHLGYAIGGGDVFGKHRWMLTGLAQIPDSDADDLAEVKDNHLGVIASYANAMFSPWTLSIEASAINSLERREGDDAPDVFDERKTRDLYVVVGRSWRESWGAAAAWTSTDDRIQPLAPPGEQAMPLDHRRLGGPALFFSYFGGEATPYTGLRRAVAVSTAAQYLPERFSSLDRDATSLRVGLDLVAPLPFTRRHRLSLSAVARGIFRPADLVELGGTSAIPPLWLGSNRDEPAEPSFPTPDHYRLTESLRGHEDTTFAVARLLTAELAWRYPIIIDRGVAATFGGLPSSFVRQLDLELFAAGALTENRAGDRESHLTAGGSLTLQLDLFRVPLLVRYQLARRLRDDRALVQLVGLGVPL